MGSCLILLTVGPSTWRWKNKSLGRQLIIASASQAELMNFNVPQLIINWVLRLGCEWNWRGVQEKNGLKMKDFNWNTVGFLYREMVPGVIVQFECRRKLKGKLFPRENKWQHYNANKTRHNFVTCSVQFGESPIPGIIVSPVVCNLESPLFTALLCHREVGPAGTSGCSTSEFQESENLGRKKWYIT